MNRALSLSITALLLLALSCTEEAAPPVTTTPKPTGDLIRIVGCKQFFRAEGDEKNKSCLTWTYDTETRVLELVHENAGFNCCPESIHASIAIQDGIITVSESETRAACDCNCLFDLHMRMTNVVADRYTIRIIEPYRHTDDAELLVPLDLRIQATGTYCVPRESYPWG